MISKNGTQFYCGITYVSDLTGNLRIGGLQGDGLARLFRDGRRLGLFVAPMLAHHFSNLTIADSGAKEQSLLVDQATGDRLRSKMLTGQGCDFAMSLQLGTQRSFRDQAYLNHWTDDIDGWVIIDNRNIPIIRIAGIHKARVPPPKHRISVTEWDALVRDNSERVNVQ